MTSNISTVKLIEYKRDSNSLNKETKVYLDENFKNIQSLYQEKYLKSQKDTVDKVKVASIESGSEILSNAITGELTAGNFLESIGGAVAVANPILGALVSGSGMVVSSIEDNLEKSIQEGRLYKVYSDGLTRTLINQGIDRDTAYDKSIEINRKIQGKNYINDEIIKNKVIPMLSLNKELSVKRISEIAEYADILLSKNVSSDKIYSYITNKEFYVMERESKQYSGDYEFLKRNTISSDKIIEEQESHTVSYQRKKDRANKKNIVDQFYNRRINLSNEYLPDYNKIDDLMDAIKYLEENEKYFNNYENELKLLYENYFSKATDKEMKDFALIYGGKYEKLDGGYKYENENLLFTKERVEHGYPYSGTEDKLTVKDYSGLINKNKDYNKDFNDEEFIQIKNLVQELYTLNKQTTVKSDTSTTNLIDQKKLELEKLSSGDLNTFKLEMMDKLKLITEYKGASFNYEEVEQTDQLIAFVSEILDKRKKNEEESNLENNSQNGTTLQIDSNGYPIENIQDYLLSREIEEIYMTRLDLFTEYNNQINTIITIFDEKMKSYSSGDFGVEKNININEGYIPPIAGTVLTPEQMQQIASLVQVEANIMPQISVPTELAVRLNREEVIKGEDILTNFSGLIETAIKNQFHSSLTNTIDSENQTEGSGVKKGNYTKKGNGAKK